jgi:hypothetical protein
VPKVCRFTLKHPPQRLKKQFTLQPFTINLLPNPFGKRCIHWHKLFAG